MQRSSSEWLIPVVLAVAAAAALLFYWSRISTDAPPPTQPASRPVAVEPASPPEPVHPVAPPVAVADEQAELVPLPSLDQSDEYFKLGLTDVFGDPVAEMLVESGVIEKIVATIDNLPRAQVAEKIRPIGPVVDGFRAEGQDDSGEYFISDTNYERYELAVDMVSEANLKALTDLYRRFYPLFQSAYENLGYPDAYFNDRLVEVIDHLLETPNVQGPIALVRPHVLYVYADESLENLSSGQKMIIRMGTVNADKTKHALGELRKMVTAL